MGDVEQLRRLDIPDAFEGIADIGGSELQTGETGLEGAVPGLGGSRNAFEARPSIRGADDRKTL